MRVRTFVFLGIVLAAGLQMDAQSDHASQRHEQSQPKTRVTQSSAPENDGERVFMQNCSRCHNAPESFPSTISGTIVRHMRVRANLSERDVRALLRFFNP